MPLDPAEHALLDDLPLPALIVDDTGTVAWANHAAAAQMGRKRDDLVGEPFAGLWGAMDEDSVRRAWSALRAGEGEVRFHTACAGDEGMLAWRGRVRADGQILVVAEGGGQEAAADAALAEEPAGEGQQPATAGRWELDIPSGNLWWSDEIYRIFGLIPGAGQPTYDDFLQAVHPDDRAYVRGAVEAALEGTPYAIDHRIVRPDGSQRLVHEQGAVSFDAQDRPCRMKGTVQDLTARKRTEELLREKDARHRQLLDGLAEGVFGVDRGGRLTFLNRAARRMLGLSSEAAVLGRQYHSLIHPPDTGAADSADPVQEVMANGEPRPPWEDRYVRSDGTTFPVEVYVAPLTDDEGRFAGVVVSFQDISARRELESARSQLVAILEATPDFVSFADPDGTIRYINRGGREMLGLPVGGEGGPLSPVLGGEQRAGDYAHPEWARRLLRNEALPTAVAEGRWQGESALLNQAGEEIPVSQVILAHYGDAGELVRLSTIMRDISEQKRLEAELEAEATHDPLTGVSNRLRFEQVLAHEIRRSDRDGRPLSLIMFDLDHFKQVNDGHGHAVGDRVLTTVAQRVQEAMRASDLLARWGGEEFMVLLPDTGRAGAQQLAEKLRAVMAEAAFPPVGHLTVSLGVTQRQPLEGEDPLVLRVDEALYRAKAEGRNRVASA